MGSAPESGLDPHPTFRNLRINRIISSNERVLRLTRLQAPTRPANGRDVICPAALLRMRRGVDSGSLVVAHSRAMAMKRTVATHGPGGGPPTGLQAHGQSVWVDYLRRDFLMQGGLRALIERDGVSGVTTDTATFTHAIAWTGQYDTAVAEWIRRGETQSAALYERLICTDIQSAADQMRDIYERSDRREGFVLVPVSPQHADDAHALLAAGLRLWTAIDRPNVLLGVPATSAGQAALQELLTRGCNAGATMICDLDTYELAVEAYFRALERTAGELNRTATIAAISVERIAAASNLATGPSGPEATIDQSSGFAMALDFARKAYLRWGQLHSGRRWTALAARGARPQRLLFMASTAAPTTPPPEDWLAGLRVRDTVLALPIAMFDRWRTGGAPRSPLPAQALVADSRRTGTSALEPKPANQAVLRDLLEQQRAHLATVLAALDRKRTEVLTGLLPLNPGGPVASPKESR